jgi:hypothetical protein
VQCPFLVHVALAVTAAHDRYLGLTPTCRRSLRESQHWALCTTLFNKWLRQPIQEEHKDPLWATAALLGILTFSSTNRHSPEEVWPLGPDDSSDLEWLPLGASKMALWRLVNPLRPGSVFRLASKDFESMREARPEQGIEGVLPSLVQLCGLDETSTQESNPYFKIAHSLSLLFHVSDGTNLYGKIVMVMGDLSHSMRTNLESKDPLALLLFGLWYTKARKVKWWIDFRARYELPAICMYLRKYHAQNHAIQALIPWDDAKTDASIFDT